jgi:hypothetical protein
MTTGLESVCYVSGGMPFAMSLKVRCGVPLGTSIPRLGMHTPTRTVGGEAVTWVHHREVARANPKLDIQD